MITVNDTEAPTFVSPGDLTGVCSPSEHDVYTSYTDFINAGGSASDNCTLVEASFALQSEVSDGNTCPEIITRIYEIADQCGNISTFEQIFTVDDDIAPTMSCPGDLTAVCSIDEQPVYTDYASFVGAGGSASDNCGLNESSFDLQSEVSDGNTCPETITRTYYIEDNCGNGVTCEQIIVIDDDIAPMMTCPGDLTAICDASEQPVYADYASFVSAGGSASDNCAIDESTFVLQSEVSDGNTCPETITRTYYIEDLCGNGVTCEQVVVLNDETLPTMTCPGDLTAVCSIDEQPAYSDYASFIGAGGSASDNCEINEDSFVLQSEVSDGNSCPETVTRIYYVEDLCGNGVTCEQVIVIDDEEAPMMTCPADFDLVCSIDEEAPYSDYASFVGAGGSASDNCAIDESTFVLQSEVSDGNTCPEVITRTYYIEDLCGNGVTCEQVITVNDTEAPTFVSPGDLNGVCSISEHEIYVTFNDFIDAGGSAGDNCTLVESSFALQSETTDGNSCPETFTRIYEIADACGNISTFTQNVIIDDEELPTISCPENKMAICSSDEVPVYTDLASFIADGGSVSDNCGINENSFELQSEVSDGNSCPETIIRTYYIEDFCGNAQVCQQEVVVNDEEAPLMTPPGDLTAICDVDEHPAYTSLNEFISAGGTVSDNCEIDENSFILQSEVSDGNTCPEIVTRTYYIQDLCGNGVSVTQQIEINDEELPILTCPGDLTAVCSIADLPAYDDFNSFVADGGSASDNCEINENSFVLQSEVSDGNTCPETVVRTYYVEDLCGNATTCQQTIVINDDINPEISELPDLTFSCAISEYPPFATYQDFVANGYSASDNCEINESSFVLQSEVSDGNNCPEKIERVYYIEDLCGNSVTVTQSIEIIDLIAPIIEPLATQNFNCAEELVPPLTTYDDYIDAGGSASDNCGIVESSFTLVSEINDGNTCPETITRTYSITDVCGNVSEFDHILTINDEIPPTLTCPDLLTARCDISEIPAYTNYEQFTEAGGNASDNCQLDESSFTLLNQMTNGQSCPEIITRIYQIADLCGNTAICQQEIFINDEEAPIINCPSELNAVCSATEHIPYQNYFEFTEAGGSASDNCEIREESFTMIQELSDGNTCPETITRIYQIEDLCGNTATCAQIVTVNDEIAPIFVAAPDLSTSCSIDEILPFTSINEFKAGGGNVTDNCALDQNSFTIISEVSDENTCPETITRIYQVADLCGNTSTVEHIITINDLIAPIIICPAPQLISCSIDDLPAYQNLMEFNNAGGITSDNCAIDELSFALVSETSDGQTCPETITRIYSIKDLCGNESTCEQIITVNDIVPPTISGIEVLNGQCDISEVPPYTSLEEFINDGGSVSDNCEVDEGSFYLDTEIIGEFTCPKLVGRVYIVSDICGNTSSFAQSILIDDTTPPELTCPPAEFGICSSDEIPVLNSFQEFVDAGGSVEENCEIDEDSFTFVEDEIITNSCPQTINRIYSIADVCGNIGTCSQEIIINDEVAPVITSPFNKYGDCDISEHPPYATLEEFIEDGGGASDNCAIDPASFTLLEETTPPLTCPAVTTRIYMVSDYCGNTSTSEHMITINDDILPEITCPAAIVNICDIEDYQAATTLSEFELAGGSVSDNCGIDVSSFELLEEVISESTCPLLVTRVYQIADNCGNVNTCSQEITVNDEEAPVITSCPVDITLQCNTETNQASIDQWLSGFSATDNCGIAEISNNYQDPNGPCEGVGTTTVEFTVIDNCDNVATCMATLTIIDTLPPIADDLIDVIIDSLNQIPPVDITIVTGVSDNCDAFPTIIWESDEYETNTSCSGDNLTITRTYQVIDCSGNITDVVQTILMDDDPIVVTVEKENVICKNDLSGSIDISVEGGNPDYTYDWNIDDYDGMTNLTDLPAGTYSVTVEDSNECTVEKTIVITEPNEAIQVEIIPDNPTICEGSAIELTNFIEFGTAPYTYEWSFEDETFNEESITASLAGDYTLTVIDGLGCEASDVITLSLIPTVELDPIQSVPGCEYAILPEITGTNLSGNEAFYTQSGGNGTVFNAGDTIWSNTNLFIYDETGTTPNCFDELNIEVVLNDGATINNPGDQLVCESYTLPEITGSNLTDEVGYYSQPEGQGTQFMAGDLITENTTMYIFDPGEECSTEIVFDIEIIEKPEIDPIDDVEVCDSYELPTITGENLTGNQAYYTDQGGNGTKYLEGQIINSSIDLYIFDGGSTCNDEEFVSITIFETPSIDALEDITVCNYFVLEEITGSDLTGNEAYYSGSNGTGQQWIAGDTIFESINLYIFDQEGVCFDEDTVQINLVETPVIYPLDNVTTCDYFVLPEILGENLTGNESYFNAPNGLGNEFNPGDTIFESIILYIYDVAGSCFDQDQFTITVGGAPDIYEPNPITECGFAILPEIDGENLSDNVAYYTEQNGSGVEYQVGDTIWMDQTLYLFIESGSCSDEELISITILSSPILNQPEDVISCDAYILPEITGTNLTGSEAYYSQAGGNGTQYQEGDVIEISTTLYIRDENDICDDEVFFSITIIETPILDELPSVEVCDFYSLPTISGQNLNNPRYYTEEQGEGDIYFPGDQITESILLYAFDSNNDCSDQQPLDITILITPDIFNPEDVEQCDEFILPEINGTDLSENVSYYSEPNGQGETFEPGDLITESVELYLFDQNNECFDEENILIVINDSPTLVQPDSVAVCDVYTLPEILGENLSGNEAYFQFQNGQGTSYQPGDVIDVSMTLYIWDESNGCSAETSFPITIIATPELDQPADLTVCALFELPEITGTNLSDNPMYFTEANQGGISYSAGDTIYNSTELFIYDANDNCIDEVSFTVEILEGPNVSDIPDVEVCVSFVLPEIEGINLTENAAYYSGPNGTGSIYEVGEEITENTTIYIYDAVATCSDEESFDIFITGEPVLSQPSNVESCDYFILSSIEGVNLSGNEMYYDLPNQEGNSYSEGDTIFETSVLYIYDNYSDCFDEVSFEIVINSTPELDFIDDVIVCDYYVLPEITGTDLNDPVFSDGTAGTGTQYLAGDTIWNELTIYVYDIIGACSDQVSFDIEFSPAPILNQIDDVESCDYFVLPNIFGQNLTGNQAYYSGPNATGTEYEIGDTIWASMNIFAYDLAGTCFDEVDFNIEILTTPEIDEIEDVVVCDFHVLEEITGQNMESAVYSTQPFGNGEVFEIGDTIFEPMTIFVFAENGICSSTADFEVIFSGAPNINPLVDQEQCEFYVLPNITGVNLTGNQSYFSESNAMGTSYEIGDTIWSSMTIYAYDMAGSCFDEESFEIVINTTPQLDALEDVVVCDYFVLPVITGSDLNNPIYSNGPNGTGVQYESGDTIWNAMTVYLYDIVGDCFDQESFEIQFSPAPVLDQIEDVVACDYFVLTEILGQNLTGNESYYSESNAMGTTYAMGDTIWTTTTIYAHDIAGGCFSEVEFNIEIIATPELEEIEDVVVCDFHVLGEIIGQNIGSAVYSTQPLGDGEVFQVGDTIFEPMTIFIFAENGICSASEDFDVVFSGIPNINPLENQEHCDFYVLPEITGVNLTGNEAYYTESEGQGTAFISGDTIWESTELYLYDVAGGCFDEELVQITINLTPALDAINNIEICDFYVLPEVSGTDLNNPLYYTEPNGQGTSYQEGDTIFGAITLYVYDALGVCSDEVQFTITTGAQPIAVLSGGGDICVDEGAVAELNITITGSFPINLDLYNDNEWVEQLVIESSPYTIEVQEPGVYTIDNLITADQCTGETSGDAVVTVLESIVVSDYTTECSVDGMSFTVSFEISEGLAATYVVNGEFVNTNGEEPFIYEETFNVGSGPFQFTIADANACNEVIIEGEEPNCECETAVGEMQNELMAFCDTNESISATYDNSNEVLEDDDVLVFILHEGTATSIGDIIATNTVAEFTFDPNLMNLDEIYYVSAVVGNAGNPVDFNDPCLGISSTPVIFYSTPTATIDGNQEDCLDSELTVPVYFEGVGPWELTYTINGEEFTVTDIADSPFEITVVLDENKTIELVEIHSENCPGDVYGIVELTIVDELFSELIEETTICNLELKGSIVNFDDLIIDGITNGIWTDLDNSNATGSFPILNFDGVQPGMYTFQYVIGQGSDCGEETYFVEIEVIECFCPNVDINAPDPICVGETVDLNQLVNGDPGSWVIVNNPSNNFEIDSDNQLITSGTEGAILSLLFTLNDIDPDCPSDSLVTIIVDNQVFAGEDQELFFCEASSDIIVLDDLVQEATATGEWTIPTTLEDAYDAGSNTLDISMINQGTYDLVYTVFSEHQICDADQLTINITLSELPEISIEDALPLDCDNVTTSIDASASSTGPEFEYQWTTTDGNIVGNDTLSSIVVNAPGTYVLEIINEETQCSIIDSIVVTGSSDFVVSNAGEDKLLTCAEIVVMLDGSASSQGDYIYQWLDGEGNPIDGANSVYYETGEDGTYILMVQNENSGCTNFDTVIVSEIINYPLAILDEANILDCDNLNVLIDGSNSTDNDFVNYYWTNAAGESIGGDSLFLMVDEPGLYILNVIDSTNMCEAVDSIMVEQNIETLNVSVSPDVQLDCNTSEATISATIENGNQSIVWYNESSIEITNDLSFSTDSAGVYTIEVTNLDNGCISSEEVVVELDTAAVDFEIETINPCDDPIGGSIQATVIEASGEVEFTLSNGYSNNSGNFSGLQSGTYEVIAVASNGCEAVQSVELHGYDDYMLDAGEDHTIDLGESVQLYAETDIETSNIADINWIPEDGSLDCTDCIDPLATPFYTTEYTVILEDVFGCMLEDNITIRVDRRTKVYAPNIFTPNNDGVNDMWTLYSASNIDLINEIKVFNRWGEHVWENHNIETGVESEGWDGTFKGQPLNPGVYAWYAIVTLIDGTQTTLKGDVTIIK